MPTMPTFCRAATRRFLPTVLLCGFSFAGAAASDTPSAVNTENVQQIDSATRRIEIRKADVLLLEYPDWLTTVKSLDPTVIRVWAVRPNCLRVQGLEQGVTTMVVTDKNKQVHTIEVFVSGDARLLQWLQSALNGAFPDSAIQATMPRGSAVLLRGWVNDAQQVSNITDLANLYSPNVVNQVRVVQWPVMSLMDAGSVSLAFSQSR